MWHVLCACRIQSWSCKNECRSGQTEMDNEVLKQYYITWWNFSHLVFYLCLSFHQYTVPIYSLFPVTSNSQYYANADYLQNKFEVPLSKSYLELHLAYSSWRDSFWMSNSLKSHLSVLGDQMQPCDWSHIYLLLHQIQLRECFESMYNPNYNLLIKCFPT